MPIRNLCEPGLLELLAGARVGLIAAVFPDDIGNVAELTMRCRDAGVGIDLWPMLDDARGRWVNATTLPGVAEMVRELVSVLQQNDTKADGVMFDLEPPIETLHAIVRERGLNRMRHLRRWIRRAAGENRHAAEGLQAVVETIHASGMHSEATTLPLVIADGRGGGWQRALATPVTDVGFRHINFMLYSSMFESYAIRWMGRRAAVDLVGAWARAVHTRFGVRGGVSIGLTGPGALGDEPCYASIEQLREDVAVVRACGVDDLCLHGLAGVLGRGPERWLDCFATTPPAAGVGRRRWVTKSILGTAEMASWALARWTRERPIQTAVGRSSA